MNYSILVTETKELCKKENAINAQIIRNLTIISENKIHLEMGYGSLFEFCIEELKLSAASTQRKIDAVRISAAVPDIADRLEKGQISLTKVSQVSKFMRDEKKFVDRTFTKTEVKAIVNEIQSTKTEFETQKVLSLKSEITVKPMDEKIKVASGGRQSLQIEVDDELLDLLKQVRELVSHEGYQTTSQLIKKSLRFFLSKKHPGQNMTQRFVPRGSENSKNKRYIHSNLKRLVWKKYGSSCAFIDSKTGKRCHSRFRLQMEHIHPIALGGKSTEENLTLYCQAHNLYSANQLGLLGNNQGHS